MIDYEPNRPLKKAPRKLTTRQKPRNTARGKKAIKTIVSMSLLRLFV